MKRLIAVLGVAIGASVVACSGPDNKQSEERKPIPAVLQAEDAEHYKDLAYDFSQRGMTHEAEAALRVIHLLRQGGTDREFVDAYHVLGRLLSAQGKYAEEAVSVCRKAVALDPDSPSLLVYLGDALVGWAARSGSSSSAREAVSVYRKAIELEPKFVRAYRKLGLLYERLDRGQEAKEAYARADELLKDGATEDVEFW